ncbi:hypothetical protein DDF62_14450 [Caulobacter radicis]|nr:hypothetical protein DDF62_14450 [Caulobacter radicis]
MFAPEPAVAPAHVASLPVTPTPVATAPATDWSGALPDPASWDPAPDYTYLLLTHAALCGHEDAHQPIGDPPQAPDAPS